MLWMFRNGHLTVELLQKSGGCEKNANASGCQAENGRHQQHFEKSFLFTVCLCLLFLLFQSLSVDVSCSPAADAVAAASLLSSAASPSANFIQTETTCLES